MTWLRAKGRSLRMDLRRRGGRSSARSVVARCTGATSSGSIIEATVVGALGTRLMSNRGSTITAMASMRSMSGGARSCLRPPAFCTCVAVLQVLCCSVLRVVLYTVILYCTCCAVLQLPCEGFVRQGCLVQVRASLPVGSDAVLHVVCANVGNFLSCTTSRGGSFTVKRGIRLQRAARYCTVHFMRRSPRTPTSW